MKITVEIGNAEQRQLIIEELEAFRGICGLLPSDPGIAEVIVGADFDATINRLQGTSDYRSIRGQATIAKALCVGDVIFVVLSPLLYTEGWDRQMRTELYVHEIIHAVNRRQFPQCAKWVNPTERRLYENLYACLDEYAATRVALEAAEGAFSEKGDRYVAFVKDMYRGYVNPLIDGSYYRRIKTQVTLFRLHGDIGTFLENTREPMNEVFQMCVRGFACLDACPWLQAEPCNLLDSPFVNGKTLALISFIRERHISKNLDLADGFPLMEAFTANLGVRFEQQPDREYCHVLDI